MVFRDACKQMLCKLHHASHIPHLKSQITDHTTRDYYP